MVPAIKQEDIPMMNVESSNVKAIGYQDGYLKVEYLNGGIYLYQDVEEYHYKTLTENVKSVGKYMNDVIKKNADKYKCVKV